MNIYIAASWSQRDRVRSMAVKLREYGASVYDFTDAACRDVPEIPPERFPEQYDPLVSSYKDYITAVPEWKQAVECNRTALESASHVVMLLPCGNDSHADAYYALGRGAELVVVGQPRKGERTPSHLWADKILESDVDALLYVRSEIVREREVKSLFCGQTDFWCCESHGTHRESQTADRDCPCSCHRGYRRTERPTP